MGIVVASFVRESITEASMLYVLAFNLLGPRPIAKPVKHLEEIGTAVGKQLACGEILSREGFQPDNSMTIQW